MNLVTGATGFIGGQLVRRLVAQGQPVRAFVRPTSDLTDLEEMDVETATGDLDEATSIENAMRCVDTVYHCGGIVSDWGRRSSFMKTNVEGTRHVLEAAVDARVRRLVYLSSASVYGYLCKRMHHESDPLRSRGIPYIESKIEAEKIVQQAIHQNLIDAIILRPVMVFGPRCQNYVGEIVWHLQQGSMLLLDRGRHEAGLAYVENVVDACLLASRHENVQHRVFNIHDDNHVTWKEYVVALAEGIGLKPPTFSLPTRLAYGLAACMESGGKLVRRKDRPILTRLAVLELGQSQQYDIARARRELGYTPTVGFESAMQTTLDWVRKSM